MVSPIPIAALRTGEVAEVREVVGPPLEVRRLEELGFRSGVVLEMVRGGTPCIIRIAGSTLCFRDEGPLRVLVAPRKTAWRVAAELAVGQAGRVVRVAGTGAVGRRLLEMGVTPGTEIRRIGTAPLGDPLEFEIRGFRLSLRKTEAQQIEIECQNVSRCVGE